MKSGIFFLTACTALYSCSRSNNEDKSASEIQPIRITMDSTGHVQSAVVEKTNATNIDGNAYDKLENYLTTNTNGGGVETIDFDCAIVVYPNDAQVDEMIKEEGAEDFYTGADDYNFYQGQAMGKIDSLGIRTFIARGKFLKLQGNKKTWTLDVRKKNLPAWNLIFFKKTKEPRIMSTVDLTEEQIGEYFEREK